MVNDWVAAILDAVRSIDPVLRVLVAGLGMFLETSVLVGLVVPGDSVVLVSSTAVMGPAEFFALIAAVIVGALGGESVGFAIGRWFGPRIHDSWVGSRVGERHWTRSQRYFERRGGIAVFASRFLPVLHSLVPITAGMSTMRYRRFMAWTVPASVLWAASYVSVGALAAGTYRELAASLHGAGFVFVGIIVVFLILVIGVKSLVQRSQAKHMTADSTAADTAPATGNDTATDTAGITERPAPEAPLG